MKFEVWPTVDWAKCGSIEVMNRSYLLPRTWYIGTRIYMDWQPTVTEVLDRQKKEIFG